MIEVVLALARGPSLRRAAALVSGRPEGVFATQTAPGGKPFFPDAPEWRFSVSHSGGLWACALGPVSLGLDVQQRRAARFEALARRWFHPGEVAWLEERGFDAVGFHEVWAAKEAYVKWTGEGIGAGFAAVNTREPPPGVCLRPLPLCAGFACCLCAGEPLAVRTLWL